VDGYRHCERCECLFTFMTYILVNQISVVARSQNEESRYGMIIYKLKYLINIEM